MKKDLIIPEMESLEEVRKHTTKIQPKNTNSDGNIEFEEFIWKTIDKLKQYKNKLKTIRNNADLISIIRGKYEFEMPKKIKAPEIVHDILGKTPTFKGPSGLVWGMKIIIEYFEYIAKRYLTLKKQNIPMLNNQLFSDNEIIVNSDSIKLLDEVRKYLVEVIKKLNEYSIINDYIRDDLNEIFEAYLSGLDKIREFGISRYKKGKSFSYLASKLRGLDLD